MTDKKKEEKKKKKKKKNTTKIRSKPKRDGKKLGDIKKKVGSRASD